MKYRNRLSHVAMYCEDLEKSIRFYETLGLKRLYDIKSEDGVPWCVFMKVCDGQYIELQQVNCPANPHPHPKQTRYYFDECIWHFALETDDLAEWIQTMTGRGIECWKDPDKTERVNSIDDVFLSEDRILCMWVIDPDGSPFEVQQVLEDSPRLG